MWGRKTGTESLPSYCWYKILVFCAILCAMLLVWKLCQAQILGVAGKIGNPNYTAAGEFFSPAPLLVDYDPQRSQALTSDGMASFFTPILLAQLTTGHRGEYRNSTLTYLVCIIFLSLASQESLGRDVGDHISLGSWSI